MSLPTCPDCGDPKWHDNASCPQCRNTSLATTPAREAGSAEVRWEVRRSKELLEGGTAREPSDELAWTAARVRAATAAAWSAYVYGVVDVSLVGLRDGVEHAEKFRMHCRHSAQPAKSESPS